MSGDSLIDQALAAFKATPPVRFGDSVEVTPEQAIVYNVYLAAKDRDRPYGSEAQLERAIRDARGVGVSQDEVDAALVAAGREEPSSRRG